jgi:hypothetical protein
VELAIDEGGHSRSWIHPAAKVFAEAPVPHEQDLDERVGEATVVDLVDLRHFVEDPWATGG